jgi:hypothetical protein
VPAVLGFRTTLIVHELFAAKLEPQLFVAAKSPLAAIEVMASADVVSLKSDAVCVVLDTPTVRLPKSSDEVESATPARMLTYP